MDIDRLRAEYREILIGGGRWQWWLTAHLPSGLPSGEYNRYVKKIRHTLMKEYRGQIGYVGLYISSPYHSNHFHSLWLAKFPSGESLQDLDLKIWRKKIGKITHCRSGVNLQRITSPASLDGIINYMVGPSNIVTADDATIIGPWGWLATGRVKPSKIAPTASFLS